MTAGSGRRLCACFDLSSPLGRCSRILLGSETWASPEFYLNWKVKATRCGCSVFQLAPSAPRTGESDTGLFAAGWGTPNCMDEIGPRSQEALARAKKKAGCCNIKDQLPQVWPTPRSEDSESTGAHRGVPDTPTSAAKAAWATPNKAAESGGPCRPEGRAGHSVETIDQLHQATGQITSGCLARTEKFVERLTTLSAWLMGYTGAYLVHWATASCGRLRRKSSKP